MLGKHVWKALTHSNRYGLTMLVRNDSLVEHPNHNFSGKFVAVDYESDDSLVAALTGQDVLVSVLGKAALTLQPRLFRAAAAANVKRIIPSEFGGDLRHPRTKTFPTYYQKVAVEEQLEELRREAGISYTLIFTNVLLDWAMSSRGALLLDPASRRVRLYDGGNVKFSTTSTATVEKAVVAVLDHYDRTENRALYVQNVAMTENELLQMAREVTSGDNGPAWVVEDVDTAKLEQTARSSLDRGSEITLEVFYAFAVRATFGDGYGGHFFHCDDDLLGIKGLEMAQLKELVRECVS
ncbi:hypothetical protein B0J13DRAFT_588994 [Dactylonectria estremocensis]|uniref:NmrA-like domain-containing protein n=1 Tax=Dactylonectria estremocensis TaxID=1079267 RepID=A0A9P9DTQ9_9HYPO|nr:hypothetical protein B0J13DRAFT_588994 [Dactylonectria estremocensis]